MSARERRYLLSLLIQLSIAPWVVHDWDGFVFTRSVKDFLVGATPYAIVEADPTYIHVGHSWPPLNTWYAYPPLPLLLMTPALAVAFGSAAAPWLVRIALKLPFIVGTLGLAWVGERVVSIKGDDESGEDWERLILFNPFLLFVSAAWGMFDAWMIGLLLLSTLLLERGRVQLAGAAFGASALVKLFPLFAAPAFFFFVAARRGRAQAVRFAAVAAATFAVVSLPFAAFHPRGFALQVLWMHLQRPPQGLSLPSVATETARFAVAEGWLQHEPSFRTIAALTFGLTLGVTVATTATLARARSSGALVRSLLGLFLGVLLTSKVLNEQYFVIPVTLCAFVWCSSRARWALAGYRAFTVGAFVASLLLGWHIFTFLPAGVADVLFGRRGNVLVGQLASASKLSPAAFAFAPVLVSLVVLLPAFVIGARRVVRDSRSGARILAVFARRRAPRIQLRAPTILALLVLTPMGVQAAALFGPPPTSPRASPLDSSNRRVGAFYYMWWANPLHDPTVSDGNWRDGVSERPLDGYYTVSSAKLRSDFRLARSHGIDLMVNSFHEYDLPLLPAAMQAAYEQDVAVAPLIEIGDIYMRREFGAPGGGFLLDDRTERAIVDLTSKALDVYATAPAAYRPGGKPAVFIYDAYFSDADYSPPFLDRLLQHASSIADQDARATGGAAPSRADLEATTPHSLDAMLSDARYAEIWRRAYADLYGAFWKGVRRDLEKRFGPIFLCSGESWNPGLSFHHGSEVGVEDTRIFDASFLYSPSFVWVVHKGDSYERNWERWVVRSVLQAQYARGAGHPVVATVNPIYDDRVLRKKKGFTIPGVGPRGNTYDLTWGFAADLSPDLVLVSTWNEFFEGSAVEPTVEHGGAFLKQTEEWSRRLRSSSRPNKRGLVLTGEASSHFTAGVADPSVDGRYAHSLQLIAERDLPDYSFDALDVDAPDLKDKDLSVYELVLVEPGLDVASPAVATAVERLERWATHGGRLLVSGVPAGSGWQRLARASGSTAADDATYVTTIDGSELTIAPASRPYSCEVTDSQVFLRYADGSARGRPAAWSRQVGKGLVAASSLNVTGREPYPGAEASAVFCACVRPLLAIGDRCENAHPDVVP